MAFMRLLGPEKGNDKKSHFGYVAITIGTCPYFFLIEIFFLSLFVCFIIFNIYFLNADIFLLSGKEKRKLPTWKISPMNICRKMHA